MYINYTDPILYIKADSIPISAINLFFISIDEEGNEIGDKEMYKGIVLSEPKNVEINIIEQHTRTTLEQNDKDLQIEIIMENGYIIHYNFKANNQPIH